MNMEIARQGLNKYYQDAMARNTLDPSVMKEFLEPIFQQAGYREPAQAGTPARILVIRDDAAGDFILFSPFLRELKRIYQGAEITLLASSRNINLAQCCPYVDHIIMNGALGEYPNPGAALRGCLNVAISLLEYNFDLAFSPRLGINSFSTLLGYLCGATQVVAFSNDRYSPLQGKVVEQGWDCLMSVSVPADDLPKHDVNTNLFMLEYMLRAPLVHRQLELWMTQADQDKARELLYAPYPLAAAAKKGKKGRKAPKPKLLAGPWADRFTYLIGVMPGASLPMKQWPVERYAQVLRQILKDNPQMGNKTVTKNLNKSV